MGPETQKDNPIGGVTEGTPTGEPSERRLARVVNNESPVSSNKPTAVLLSHGSFNPVHLGHLEMMNSSKKALEAAGYDVIEGIMEITSQGHLAKKGVPALSDTHRLEAIKIATMEAEHSWLRASDKGIRHSSGEGIIRGERNHLEKRYPGAAVFNVIGADTALKYKYKPTMPTVVVYRPGHVVTEELKQEMASSTVETHLAG